MNNPSILVIDDSATIRKLANSALCKAGYQVGLAPTAETGISMATEGLPDLIILDHQLPGTTGLEVCRQLLANEDLQAIPVIISSTLRKQAYVEYAECSNVIDMLPKPYTEESLTTTVQQGLETGRMVVDSQAHGTAVPEVIQALEGCEISGMLNMFSVREILDFLNNGAKNGVLEVESDAWRVWFYLRDGRIQAVTANGVSSTPIVESLPESLSGLAPILNLTIGGRSGSELDGVVQLLNTKVIDARLLGKVLRHQAAMLALKCFTHEPKEFRFEPNSVLPPLFRDVPLEISLLALLVDATARCANELIPNDNSNVEFVRSKIRGQNLDRAGLMARQQQIVARLSRATTVEELSQETNLASDEIQRLLHGLSLVNLVERRVRNSEPVAILLEPNQELASHMREVAEQIPGVQLKVVRDRLAFQLLLQRDAPQVVFLDADDQAEAQKVVDQIRAAGREMPTLIAIVDINTPSDKQPEWCEQMLTRPYTVNQLREYLLGSQTPHLTTDMLESETEMPTVDAVKDSGNWLDSQEFSESQVG